ncbi:MAG TPA: mechanosensitive ion channel family protein [Mycobacterium sp.]
MPTTLEHLGHWTLTKGLHIVLVVTFTIIATRVIRWIAGRISRRLSDADDGGTTVRSEAAKHRQAVASVISSVAISLLYVMVAVDIANQIGLPIGSLVAPAAVLGAALGFGAQRIVQDLLSGFFVITEKQYGFGDLVEVTVNGGGEARGTVEDVTLRVTKLRTSDGEVFTVPNGQIVKSLNLSKDWARAVVDIPVPATADINRVNEVLRDVTTTASHVDDLPDLLLDEPQLMGVESIEKDTVKLRMVARTLPGKQFEVGRRLRSLVVSALRRAGVATSGVETTEMGVSQS